MDVGRYLLCQIACRGGRSTLNVCTVCIHGPDRLLYDNSTSRVHSKAVSSNGGFKRFQAPSCSNTGSLPGAEIIRFDILYCRYGDLLFFVRPPNVFTRSNYTYAVEQKEIPVCKRTYAPGRLPAAGIGTARRLKPLERTTCRRL